MLLVEQNVELACDLADRVHMIDQGRIVLDGTPAALRGDARTLTTYLGVGGSLAH